MIIDYNIILSSTFFVCLSSITFLHFTSVPWDAAPHDMHQQAPSSSVSSCISLMGGTDRRWDGRSNNKPFTPVAFLPLLIIGCNALSCGHYRHGPCTPFPGTVGRSPSCFIGCSQLPLVCRIGLEKWESSCQGNYISVPGAVKRQVLTYMRYTGCPLLPWAESTLWDN